MTPDVKLSNVIFYPKLNMPEVIVTLNCTNFYD